MMKTRRNAVWSRRLPPLPLPRRVDRDLFYSLAYQLLRLTLGGLFVYAGVIKLLDPKAFARAIAQFGLLPEPLLPLVAVGLPALELLAGLGLIFEVRGCLTAISALLGTFLLLLGYAILMEMDVDCGCFTVDQLNARTSVQHAFSRDLAMAAAALFLFRRRRILARRPASKPRPPG